MKHLDFFGKDSPGKTMQRATRARQIDWALNAVLTDDEIMLYYDMRFDPNMDCVTIPLAELTANELNSILWDITVDGGIILGASE